MIRLHNDYNRGACAKILEKLAETNAESYDGYGEDTWCEKAAELIRKKCNAPEAAVHFFPGAASICRRNHYGRADSESSEILL